MDKSRTGKNKIDRFTSNGQGIVLLPRTKEHQQRVDKVIKELEAEKNGKKSGK